MSFAAEVAARHRQGDAAQVEIAAAQGDPGNLAFHVTGHLRGFDWTWTIPA